MSVEATDPLESPTSRDVILSAAEALIAEIGYDKASVAKICRASNLPVGSIYHHFGSKAGLLAAVMERGSQRFQGAMPPASDLTGTPEQNMHTYWSAAADVIIENASYFILESDLTRHGQNDPDIAPIIEAGRARLSTFLGEVIKPFARQVGVPDVDELAVRLVRFTSVFTRGALIEAGQDRDRLRTLNEELYTVLRAAILQAPR